MELAVVILAAGKGRRMNSDLPKVLHSIAQAPMLAHVMATGAAISPDRTIVVAGFAADMVRSVATELDPKTQIVLQHEPLGTGHAVLQAKSALEGFSGDVLVLFGDTPFVEAATLERLRKARSRADIVILGFSASDPGQYGRIVLDGDNVARIVEFKDTTGEERAIRFCNSGVLVCNTGLLFDLLSELGNNNAAGEYYLPDIVGLARNRGLAVAAVACDETQTIGINTRSELALAEAAFQTRTRKNLLEHGVTLCAPDTVFLAYDTVIEPDAFIEPHVVFGPGVRVERGAQIRAFSHLEGCHVGRGTVVGPYARLRPGTGLAEDVRIGNFVEIKNATISKGCKINHLSYIGDADIGERTNIGAGTVTCNYNGVDKHRTTIGTNAFIGSDTMLVAPVRVGDHAMTASGSVITRDVDDGALGIARAPQETKPDGASRILRLLRAGSRRGRGK